MNIGMRKRCITRNIVRGKLNVKCVSVKLVNVIGQDIWELEAYVGGWWWKSWWWCGGDGGIRRIRLWSQLFHYLQITVIASSNTNWQSVWHLRGDIVRKKSKNIDLSFQSIPIAGEDWLRYLEKPRKSKKYVWFLPCFNQININKQTKTTSIQQSMLSCKKLWVSASFHF